MGRKKDITDFCRGQISAYAKMNVSHADIARRSLKRHLDREALGLSFRQEEVYDR